MINGLIHGSSQSLNDPVTSEHLVIKPSNISLWGYFRFKPYHNPMAMGLKKANRNSK
jgi:hypothetical protein